MPSHTHIRILRSQPIRKAESQPLIYTKADIAVRVDGPEAALRSAETILSYFGFERGPDDRPFLFEIDVTTDSEGEVFTGNLDSLASDWFGCQVLGNREVTVVIRGRSRLTIDKGGGRASIVLDYEEATGIDASDPALLLLVTFALVHALQAHGKYILHGAAVSDKDGNGILIVGESDTGKSTLTMSLIEQGWEYLSDDSLVLTHSEEGISAEPFRTDFGLDPVAEEFFPGLSEEAEPWLFGGEKWRVSIRKLYPELARPACRPHMLVFPELDPIAESRLEPVTAAEAFVRVMRQGSFLFSSDEHHGARRQIDLFSSLIGQCRLYKLVSGPDIVHNAELLSSAFSPPLRGEWESTQTKAGSTES